jgi:hypothetical protein
LERRLKIARLLVSVPALFLVLGPPVADLNASHVLNPSWSGHARLHTVWLITTNSLVCLVALRLLWRPLGGALRVSVLLAGTLVGFVLLGFFVAAATQTLYDGALTDPNGITIRVGSFDANLAAFSVLFCVLASAMVMASRPDA